MTTPRLLALAAAASFLLPASARADEVARRRLAQKTHAASQAEDPPPVPAPPLEPPVSSEGAPQAAPAEAAAPAPAAPEAAAPARPAPAPTRLAQGGDLPQRPARERPRARRQSESEAPLGLAATLSLAGGGAAGTGSRYANSRIVETELTVGYELLDGLVRPELGLLVGTYPHTYVGFRPGVRAFLPATPLYGRAAIDISEPANVLQFRWLLLGAGAELRLTDLLGVYAELDVGAPLRHQMGFPGLARAGFSARF